MLGIDLGRLRQRLGLLQRRLDGLERGAPASISNTVPHATESSWASPPAANIAKWSDPHSEHVRQILETQHALLAGRRIDLDATESIAGILIDDVERQGGFVLAPVLADDPSLNRARFSLELGRLTAFLAAADERLQASAASIVVAALLADAPLLHLIGLDETVAREHALRHGEKAATILEKTSWFSSGVLAAVAHHHGRLDGSGDPNVRAAEFSPEGRLLSVAAAYLEQRWPDADRPLADPRRSLREVLLDAESGKLDIAVAFRLLDVSFYPKATVVELSGGERAEVVATHRIGSDLELASLPIVRLLRDADGRPISAPIFWNLAQRNGCRIVRALPAVDLSKAA